MSKQEIIDIIQHRFDQNRIMMAMTWVVPDLEQQMERVEHERDAIIEWIERAK